MDAGTDYSTQMDFVEKLANFASTSITSFQKDLNVAATFANALCGIFALFYIGNIVWKSWVEGGRIDLYKCFRPFVIGFFILNFSILTSAIDFVAGGFVECSRSFVDYEQAKSEQINNQFYEAMKTMDASKIKPLESVEVKPQDDLGTNDGNGKQEVSSLEQCWNDLSQWVSETFTLESLFVWITSAFREFFSWVAQLLASLVGCCIILLSFLNKCILTFFGPLIFALSLLKHSEGMIMSWVKKYLTYSLYPAILNIINGILCGAMTMVVTGVSGSTDPNSLLGGTGMELVYINYALVGVCVASIFMYMSTPSIAGQIVDVGANAIGGSIMAASTFAMAKAGNSFKSSDLGKSIGGKLGAAATFGATGGASLGYSLIKSGFNAVMGKGSNSKKEATGSGYKGNNDKSKN